MVFRIGIVAAAFALVGTTFVAAAGTLDYEFYKAKVQPIFLTKRPGMPLRDVSCRRRQYVSPGEAVRRPDRVDRGTDAQDSDTDVEIVQSVDDPLTAKILVHPLAPETGGDAFHSGGRQFAGQGRSQLEAYRPMGSGREARAGKPASVGSAPLEGARGVPGTRKPGSDEGGFYSAAARLSGAAGGVLGLVGDHQGMLLSALRRPE